MKKVGLVTCYLDNYGACLQALALQSKIEQLGFKCDILAYIEPWGYQVEDGNFTYLRKRLNHAIKIILHPLKKRYKGTIRLKRHRKFLNFKKQYLKFQCIPNTNKTQYYNNLEEMCNLHLKYDIFVCGSDQIWNPTFYDKNNPVYHLRFANGKRTIAYAPSIGLTQLPEKYHQEFVEFIHDFDKLSVRELSGAKIIQQLSSREAKVVLDPTLLIGPLFWNTILQKNFKPHYKKYIFCYIFSNTERCSSYIKNIQNKTNLPIIYMDVSNLDYSKTTSFCYRYSDPIQFLQLLKNSEFVITDSFHGTAFSILFEKEFYVFKRERTDEQIDMFSRIDNILNCLNLQSRICEIVTPFENKETICYDLVNQKLECLRKDSENWLLQALSGE